MARRGEVLALVQAGGQGGRMDVLTRERAKPALPYGGVHRLVDFALSALVHADLVDVWVSLEYQVTSIDDYLSGGRPWSLDRNRGGFRRMVPQTGTGPATESGFAHGNGDLLLRMSADLEAFGAPTLVVCSADHVFNMDLGPGHRRARRRRPGGHGAHHRGDQEGRLGQRRGAGRGATAPSPRSSTSRRARPAARSRPRSSSTTPRSCSRTLRELRAELAGDQEGDDSGLGDFGEHVLPRLVETGKAVAVPMTGYWRDVGQPGLYLQSHRDLLAGRVDVFDHPDAAGHLALAGPSRRAGPRRPASSPTRCSRPGCDVVRRGRGQRARPRRGRGEGRRRPRQRAHGGLRGARPAPRSAPRSSTSAARSCAGARVGAEPTARLARDEDLVLAGRDCRRRRRGRRGCPARAGHRHARTSGQSSEPWCTYGAGGFIPRRHR